MMEFVVFIFVLISDCENIIGYVVLLMFNTQTYF